MYVLDLFEYWHEQKKLNAKKNGKTDENQYDSIGVKLFLKVSE